MRLHDEKQMWYILRGDKAGILITTSCVPFNFALVLDFVSSWRNLDDSSNSSRLVSGTLPGFGIFVFMIGLTFVAFAGYIRLG